MGRFFDGSSFCYILFIFNNKSGGNPPLLPDFWKVRQNRLLSTIFPTQKGVLFGQNSGKNDQFWAVSQNMPKTHA